jgi:hypothetical protein
MREERGRREREIEEKNRERGREGKERVERREE